MPSNLGHTRTFWWLCIPFKVESKTIPDPTRPIRLWSCLSALSLCSLCARHPSLHSVAGRCQARFCLRAFAQTVFPAWNPLPSELLAPPPWHHVGLCCVTCSGKMEDRAPKRTLTISCGGDRALPSGSGPVGYQYRCRLADVIPAYYKIPQKEVVSVITKGRLASEYF